MALMLKDKLKIKIPGTYTIKVDNNLEIVSMKLDMAGKYTIELDNNLKTVNVTHNEQQMKNRSALDPNHEDYIDPNDDKLKPHGFEKDNASGEPIVPGKLKHGCVGLSSICEGLSQDDPCKLIFDTWW